MNPFYKLNKTLAGIRNEPTEQQKALVESRAPKSPAKKTLEEALRSDLRSLMEDGTGGMSGSNTLESSMPDYLYLAVKIGDLFIKLHDQGKIFSHEDFEKIKDRVANHLGYNLGDRIFEKAWLEANSETNLDNDDSDYTDYSMRQGEMGRYNESKDKSLSKAAKTIKKGALHKQEGIPQDKKIGNKKLNSLKKSGTPLEKKRANFALNIQGKGKKSVKENVGMEECMECMMGECDMHGMNEAAPQGGFKKGDKVIANGAPAIVYNIDVPNNIAYVQYEADLKKGSPQTQAVVLNQLKPAAAPTSSFKKGDKVIANGAPAIVYNIDVPNNIAYVQYEADLAKGSPQTAAVVLNQLKPAVQEGYGDISELSNKTLNKVDGYKSKAQQDLKRLKKMPVDDFVNNMRQGHRIGDAANMAVQNNLKAIKQAKNRENGLDRVNTRSNKEYAEGATPDQLDKQKRLQMDRAQQLEKIVVPFNNNHHRAVHAVQKCRHSYVRVAETLD
jgi:hypothetical protein